MQGERHSYQVQKLWATLGGNKRNVVPILDFLIDRGLKECATGGWPGLIQPNLDCGLSTVADQAWCSRAGCHEGAAVGCGNSVAARQTQSKACPLCSWLSRCVAARCCRPE